MIPLAALLLAISANPEPSPSLGPAESIRAVIEALAHCNAPAPNAGIYTAYRFASPANRAVTGPYGRFLRAVKDPNFGALLEPHSTEYGPLVMFEGSRVRQIVKVRTAGGHVSAFEIQVTRQSSGPCIGCWMTDGVNRRRDLDAQNP